MRIGIFLRNEITNLTPVYADWAFARFTALALPVSTEAYILVDGKITGPRLV